MSSSSSRLKTYAGFVGRYARPFLKERSRELRTPIAPAPFRPAPHEWRDDQLTIAWLGHASVLINFYGTWLLTDPALRSRVGVRVGAVTMGPRRLVRPALTPREIPPLDALLISHAHMDHCDRATLARLPRATSVVVQRGMSDLVRRFQTTHELSWGESVEVDGARIEAIESNHWGARTLTDSHRGYGGYLIEKEDKAILFAGDTAYTHAFARLARERNGGAPIRLAILPIGAYDPYIHVHASPEQAWMMMREMDAEYILPIHHKTFRLSREPTDEPIERLLAAAGSESWRVVATEVGQTWTMEEGKR
ncbi:MAG: MBL fold metallo-hydrolase [Pyrinomonadaceae bacterium]